MKDNHGDFYAQAKYYDIAFRFKNVGEENQTILDLYRRYGGKEAKSFLDIAAGPATNAIEMAQRGLQSFALDYSQAMVRYGLDKALKVGVDLNYRQGDMRKFSLETAVDLAAIFMDSTSYLITNQDVLDHLSSVVDNLNSGGIYILEMSHPRDVFQVGRSSSTRWTEIEGDIEVQVQWGEDSDVFDPIKQTTKVTAKLQFQSPEGSGEVVEKSEQRCFTFHEIDALVRASGRFDFIDVVGSLKPGVPFSNTQDCWRMVPVLRKR